MNNRSSIKSSHYLKNVDAIQLSPDHHTGTSLTPKRTVIIFNKEKKREGGGLYINQYLEEGTIHSMKGMKEKGINVKLIIKPRFYFWKPNIENPSELCLHREKDFTLHRNNFLSH